MAYMGLNYSKSKSQIDILINLLKQILNIFGIPDILHLKVNSLRV